MSTLARDFPEYDAIEREELRTQKKHALRRGVKQPKKRPPPPALHSAPARTITYAEIQRRNGITKGAV